MNQHSLAVIFDEVAWIHEWSQGAEVECVFHYGMTGNGYENADGVEFRSCIETEVCHARR